MKPLFFTLAAFVLIAMLAALSGCAPYMLINVERLDGRTTTYEAVDTTSGFIDASHRAMEVWTCSQTDVQKTERSARYACTSKMF